MSDINEDPLKRYIQEDSVHELCKKFNISLHTFYKRLKETFNV